MLAAVPDHAKHSLMNARHLEISNPYEGIFGSDCLLLRNQIRTSKPSPRIVNAIEPRIVTSPRSRRPKQPT